MAAGSLKRVPDSGALFSFGALLLFVSMAFSSASSAEECVAESIDDYRKVNYVHDGDTVHLAGGQKVRLIGINTPELARDSVPAEPFGVAARDALRQLLKGQSRIAIQYGREREDHHGRTLAHLYLEDGRNIQQWLLEKGYAVAIAIPPNLYHADCYQRIERLARTKRAGLWRQGGPSTVDAAALRRGGEPGFRMIKGEVSGVKRTRRWVWLALAENVSLRISRDDERYFDAGLLKSLRQKRVVARGWLTQRKGRWSMRIRHPSALEVEVD